VSPPVFLQDNDDDHGHYHTRAVPLEAGGDPVPVKLYTSTCIKQAQVFAAPNGLTTDGMQLRPLFLGGQGLGLLDLEV
jgi:hypothetical protein